MRLGVFGGTFDPVHNGHLLLAERCREQLELEEVWFVPCGRPPHKDQARLSDGAARAEMLELATAGDPGLVVCRHEIDRPGVSYTAETLEAILEEDPSRELFLLVGADTLADLPGWYRPERIYELATLAVVDRDNLGPGPPLPGVRIERVQMPTIDLSSRDIRERVRQRQSIRRLVPRAVEVYLGERDLYVG